VVTTLTLAIVAAAAWTLGAAALSPFDWPELRRYERLALETTAGVGLIALLLSILLLTGTFAAATPFLLLIGLAGLAARMRRWPPAAAPHAAPGPRWARGAIALVGACAVIACAGALAPVTDRDALSYVVPIARHIADAGALRIWSDQARSMWPQAHEVVLAYMLRMGGDRLGALSALEWLLAVGATSALARRVCERPEHVPIAIALAVAAPVAAFEVASAKEDMILLAATAAALFCLAGLRTGRDAAAAGFFAGMAAGVKYPGLGVALAVVCWIAIAGRHRLRHAAIAAGCAAAAGGLWYALNLWRFGNPVAPFVFGAPGTRLDAAAVRDLMNSYGGGRGLVNFFVTPVRIFTTSSLYCGRAMLFNPLAYAGLAGLGIASARRRSGALFFTAAVLYAGWYVTLQNARLLLPAAMLLAPAAADRLVPLVRRSRAASAAAGVLLALLLLLAPMVGLVRASRYASSPSTFLDRETEFYPDIRWANAHLDPARDRIASMFGAVGYFTIPAIGVEPTYQFEFGEAELRSNDRFLAACRRQGVTHVFTPRDEFADVRSQLRLVYENPASRLGGFHFFREPPSEATAIFAIRP
jgi:hypothetical protein